MSETVFGDNAVCQVGLVVHDIQKTAQKYCEILGVEMPPILETKGFEISKTTYKGQDSDATAKLGHCKPTSDSAAPVPHRPGPLRAGRPTPGLGPSARAFVLSILHARVGGSRAHLEHTRCLFQPAVSSVPVDVPAGPVLYSSLVPPAKGGQLSKSEA